MSRRPRPARPVARAVGLLAGGALLLAACGTDGLGGESVAAPASTTTTVDLEPLELTPADPAAVLQSEDETFILDELRDATFYSDLPCGPDVQQAFDYAAPSTGSRDGPLVVFIHGGGFTKGDKDGAFEEDSPWTDTVVGLLAAGVPVASINYRLIDESNTDGVITPLTDSQRCLQEIRARADELGFDPGRVALMGSSAGAATSFWLGLGDERSEPGSPDAVARQSTRVRAMVGFEVQATIDLLRWADDVFGEFGFAPNLPVAVTRERVLGLYGVDQEEELSTPDLAEYRAATDILGFLDADDPPLWVRNEKQPATVPTSVVEPDHHPNHGRVLQEAAAAAGIEADASLPRLGLDEPPPESALDFLLRHLG
jgi:acetyl esterase/lipase